MIFRFGKDARIVIARNEAICVTTFEVSVIRSTDCFVPRNDVPHFAINNITLIFITRTLCDMAFTLLYRKEREGAQ